MITALGCSLVKCIVDLNLPVHIVPVIRDVRNEKDVIAIELRQLEAVLPPEVKLVDGVIRS